ncbi:hypothetical protein D3C80_1268950 [compost metagenome]
MALAPIVAAMVGTDNRQPVFLRVIEAPFVDLVQQSPQPVIGIAQCLLVALAEACSVAGFIRFAQLNEGEVGRRAAENLQCSQGDLFIGQAAFAHIVAMGIFEQKCGVDGRPVHHTGEVGRRQCLTQPLEQAGKCRVDPQRLGIGVNAMLVAPDPSEQGDPAWAAEGGLLAGLAGDAAGIGVRVIQTLLEVGGIAQCLVLFELHTLDADDQGFRFRPFLRRSATCQQGQRQQKQG